MEADIDTVSSEIESDTSWSELSRSSLFFCISYELNVNIGYMGHCPYNRSLVNGDYRNTVPYGKPFIERCLKRNVIVIAV